MIISKYLFLFLLFVQKINYLVVLILNKSFQTTILFVYLIFGLIRYNKITFNISFLACLSKKRESGLLKIDHDKKLNRTKPSIVPNTFNKPRNT
jgi:hypothetical protein